MRLKKGLSMMLAAAAAFSATQSAYVISASAAEEDQHIDLYLSYHLEKGEEENIGYSPDALDLRTYTNRLAKQAKKWYNRKYDNNKQKKSIRNRPHRLAMGDNKTVDVERWQQKQMGKEGIDKCRSIPGRQRL